MRLAIFSYWFHHLLGTDPKANQVSMGLNPFRMSSLTLVLSSQNNHFVFGLNFQLLSEGFSIFKVFFVCLLYTSDAADE